MTERDVRIRLISRLRAHRIVHNVSPRGPFGTRLLITLPFILEMKSIFESALGSDVVAQHFEHSRFNHGDTTIIVELEWVRQNEEKLIALFDAIYVALVIGGRG